MCLARAIEHWILNWCGAVTGRPSASNLLDLKTNPNCLFEVGDGMKPESVRSRGRFRVGVGAEVEVSHRRIWESRPRSVLIVSEGSRTDGPPPATG